MNGRLRAPAWIVLGAVCFCSSANAQQQPLCIPGTTLCINGNGQGGVSGGAHGQVGPNGASGGANGNANGNGGGYVQPPQAPQPQYPPPQPQQPPPRPPRQVPTPAPEPPAAPNVSYGPSQPSDLYPGIGVYPVMRVGTDSGFHFGGDFAFGFHGPRWGFEMEAMMLYGGTTSLVDISIVPSMILRFGADDDPAIYTGFYARLGPEFRWSFATPSDATRGQIFHLGVQAGVGYEVAVAPDVSIRILDVRAVAAWRAAEVPPPDDNFGHEHEYGLLFASGITFF